MHRFRTWSRDRPERCCLSHDLGCSDRRTVCRPVIASQTSAYIYVEDVAECLIRLSFATRLERDIYCVPTHRVSLGKIAEKLRAILPDAEIAFAPDAAGFEQINRMDGTRLKRDLRYAPSLLDDRIRHQIDVARRKRQQPPLR
ncbi:MAG: hypothetical protein VXV97_07840 [Pseudomonadota bacterium]|nr:hypothetical protein [Pseudomonadota bacterium]